MLDEIKFLQICQFALQYIPFQEWAFFASKLLRRPLLISSFTEIGPESCLINTLPQLIIDE
ncbi:hypothetical protein C0J52_11529 [Blattella germanica]|nr:hypothetical protein C0J52_11529 [Blattella germanica]